MSKNNVSELDIVPGNNADLAGISILGTGLLSTADDSFRTSASFLAKWWDDLGGVNTVAGTGDAITVTTPTVYTALKTGMRLQFIASAINTTAVTLNLDAIGAKALRKISGGTDVALAAGDIPGAKVRVDIVYDATANAAAGAWVIVGVSAANFVAKAGDTMTGALVNTGSSVSYTPYQGISTEAAAAAGPLFDLYRNSASPAAADFIGEIDFTGQNTTPAKKTYASIGTRIDDATAASEDATLILAAMKAGTLTNYLTLGANAAGTATANALGLPLGQLSFPATANDSADANTLDDYEEGTWTPIFSSTGATFSYATQYGRYTKIGRVVHVEFRIVLNGSGNTLSANVLNISSLPFAYGGTTNVYGYLGWGSATSSYVTMNVTLSNAAPSSFIVGGATAAATTGTTSQLSNAALHATNGSFMGGSFTYEI